MRLRDLLDYLGIILGVMVMSFLITCAYSSFEASL